MTKTCQPLSPAGGNPHGRPLARRDRPEGVAGPGGVARRRSMVSRLRPGELSIRHLESYRRLLLLFYTSRPWRPALSEAVAGYVHPVTGKTATSARAEPAAQHSLWVV